MIIPIYRELQNVKALIEEYSIDVCKSKVTDKTIELVLLGIDIQLSLIHDIHIYKGEYYHTIDATLTHKGVVVYYETLRGETELEVVAEFHQELVNSFWKAKDYHHRIVVSEYNQLCDK